MVITVTMLIDKQTHDMNDNFDKNLETELKELDRKKYLRDLNSLLQEWKQYGDTAGELAVKYFGSYLGSILIGIGALFILNIYKLVYFSFQFELAVILLYAGVFLIIASVYTAKIMPHPGNKESVKND